MEEKKEKKTIKCSYAVLVIALCATVAFLTDYIIIDRKTKNCDCPRCEATNNEVISENIENKDNTDNTQVIEKKTYSYGDIVGHYVGYPADFEHEKNVSSLTLYSDGTYSYGYLPAFHTIGNYIIEDNKIYMNDILSVGSDPQMHVLYSNRVLNINSDGIFIDIDANIKPDIPGLEKVDKVKYIKDNEYSSDINGFDSAMDTLNKYYIERY